MEIPKSKIGLRAGEGGVGVTCLILKKTDRKQSVTSPHHRTQPCLHAPHSPAMPDILDLQEKPEIQIFVENL